MPFQNLAERLTAAPRENLTGVTEFFLLFKRVPVDVEALGPNTPPRNVLTVTEHPGPLPSGLSFV